MTERFDKHVAYLEDSDFENGKIANPQIDKGYVFMMILGDFCGYCTQAKPAFYEAAKKIKNKGIFPVAVLTDGQEPGELELKKNNTLNKVLKNSNIQPGGVPSFVMWKDGVPLKEHTGDRSPQALLSFCKSCLEM